MKQTFNKDYYRPFQTDFDKWQRKIKNLANIDGKNQSEVWRQAYEHYLKKNTHYRDLLGSLADDLNRAREIRTKASEYATATEEIANNGIDIDIIYCCASYYVLYGKEVAEKLVEVVKNCKNYDKKRILESIYKFVELLNEGKSVEYVSFCAEFLCMDVHYYKIAENGKLVELEECCDDGISYRNTRQYANCRIEGHSKEEASAYLLCFNYPWWENEHKTKDYDDPAGAKQFLWLEFQSRYIDRELEEIFQESYAEARVFKRLSKKEAYNIAFAQVREIFINTNGCFLSNGNLASLKTPTESMRNEVESCHGDILRL